MGSEQVRMWRVAPEDPVLLMAERTTQYAVEPRGEYVFGIVAAQPMRARRGREHRLVQPGELVAWDPSDSHRGAAVDGQPWRSRLMIIEDTDLATLASDEDTPLRSDVLFPEPVVSDRKLARDFVQLHRSLEAPMTRLKRDQRLTEWLSALIERTATVARPKPPPNHRDDRALRAAYDYLADRPEPNVGLDELAAVAGVGKFRLIKLCREHTGLPPHALQIAHRVRRARRLLEAGESIADVATATGFADQSHLHRHFQRSLGMAPGEYRRRFEPVIDASTRRESEDAVAGPHR